MSGTRDNPIISYKKNAESQAAFFLFPKPSEALRKEANVIEHLAQTGKELAKEFVDSGQDIFVMTTDVDGEQVTISVRFSPPAKQISIEDMFRERFERKTLTRL